MRELLRRIQHLILVLLAVTFFTFVLIDLLPGDPAIVILGEEATPEQIALLREELNLDDNVITRYVAWIGDAVTGDLGSSYRTKQSVTEALSQRVPVSLELMAIAQVFSLVAAIPLGIYTAYRPNRRVDRWSRAVGFGMIAMPPFVFALILILVFSVGLGWFPAAGYTRFTEDLIGNIKSLILPASTLAIGQVAVYQQLLRADMLATLQEDFILMAKSKGLPTWRILLRHALRPSSFSLVTLAGINIGRLIGGAVIVEVIFAVPGIGQMLIQAVYNRDIIFLQGALLFTASAYVLVNLLVDITYLGLDPRARHSKS